MGSTILKTEALENMNYAILCIWENNIGEKYKE
jgi:hypothetical protein